jgi:hypothetical protein
MCEIYSSYYKEDKVEVLCDYCNNYCNENNA